MKKVNVNSCTDITGFGLLGHLLEMMNGSHTAAEIDVTQVPLLPGALELATSGVIPGGTKDNFDFCAPFVQYDKSISQVKRYLLNDAQTSGGLLISVPGEEANTLMTALQKNGVAKAAVIGSVIGESSIKIAVR